MVNTLDPLIRDLAEQGITLATLEASRSRAAQCLRILSRETSDLKISTVFLGETSCKDLVGPQRESLSKVLQYNKFQGSGLATPHTEKFRFGGAFTGLNSGWVMLKPDNLDTELPASTLILEARRVSKLAPYLLPGDHPIRNIPYVAQELIDTGPRAESYRVVLFCGEPISAYRITAKVVKPDLKEREINLGDSFISNRSSGYLVSLVTVPEIVTMAQKMSALFDDPVLCTCDLLRTLDGQFQALEINEWNWNLWPLGRKNLVEQIGIQALTAQFDLYKVLSQKLKGFLQS
jgi:hypothetical protein